MTASTPTPRFVRTLSTAFLLTLVLGITTPPSSASTQWPQHRGPGQDGAVRGDILPAGSVGIELGWKRALGSGYSAIAIAGDLAVTFYTDGKHDLAAAFDVESGSPRWQYVIGPMYAGHDGSASGPISSPLLHDGTVYGLGPHGKLFALRLSNGAELWSRTLDVESEAHAPFYGFTTSPMIAGEALFVLTGKDDGRLVTAFSRKDGKTLWSSGSDSAGYQTPLLAEVGGKQQLVIASNRDLSGIDPATGKVLWTKRFLETANDGYTQPVALGANRFLLSDFERAVAYELKPADGTTTAHELWNTADLKSSYAIPVLHQGHLYGFNGRFLTCVEAATGKTVWKSRPPGGRGLILVDDHLVILGTGGELVLAEANPAAYVEKARLKIFDSEGFTAPSFAAGRVFARNESEIASVRITAGSAASAPKEQLALDVSAVGGAFGAALSAIAAAPAGERSSRIDALLAKHPGGPIIEPTGRTHFVYRGAAGDVALIGSVLGPVGGEERALAQLAGTDLFVLSLDLCGACVYDYGLRIDFGDPEPDPRNALHYTAPPLKLSELRMPDWKAPAHVEEPTGPRGRVEEVSFTSQLAPGERTLQVYLPVGYDVSGARYPVAYFYNADRELGVGKITHTLDNLIGRSVRPLIAVFIPRLQREYSGPLAGDFARAVNEELVPWIDAKYRTETGPANRALIGAGAGASAAVLAAFQQEPTFGGLAVQSFYHSAEMAERVRAAIAGASRREIKIYVEKAQHELVIPAARIDAKADTHALEQLLGARGYAVLVNAVAGAPGWLHWRAQNGIILETLFPRR